MINLLYYEHWTNKNNFTYNLSTETISRIPNMHYTKIEVKPYQTSQAISIFHKLLAEKKNSPIHHSSYIKSFLENFGKCAAIPCGWSCFFTAVAELKLESKPWLNFTATHNSRQNLSQSVLSWNMIGFLCARSTVSPKNDLEYCSIQRSPTSSPSK